MSARGSGKAISGSHHNVLDERTPLLRSHTCKQHGPSHASRRQLTPQLAESDNEPEQQEVEHPQKPKSSEDEAESSREDVELGRKTDSKVIVRDSPYSGVGRAHFWLIFGGNMLGHYVACFDTTIMASSHPVVTSHFRSSNSASWLSTAFLVTAISFQPLFARFSDNLGRRLPYTIAIVILARALCGLGAGGMIAIASIVTSDLVPLGIRGPYQSLNNLVFGAGSASGAALGGVIAGSLGWRWAFGIQLPALTICLCIAILALPGKLGISEDLEKSTLRQAMKAFDWQGMALLTTAITCLVLGLASTPFLH
jgi:hypothetical protein